MGIVVTVAFFIGVFVSSPAVDAASDNNGKPFEAIWSAIENFQNRVNGTCPDNSSIKVINEDGTVDCELDSDTTYSAENPIKISGTTISLNDVGCEEGEVLKWDGGSWQCIKPVESLGYQKVSSDVKIAAGGTSFFTIACPFGTNVVGGGYSGINLGNPITESYPSSINTWTVKVSNFFPFADDFIIYALCIDDTP